MTNQCSFLLSLGTAFPTIIPPVKSTAPYGTMEPPTEPSSQEDASQEEPIGKQPWFWVVVVGVPVALVTSVIAVPRLVKRNKRRKRLNDQNNDSVAQQSTPLVPRK